MDKVDEESEKRGFLIAWFGPEFQVLNHKIYEIVIFT
jgi:hypothetical protein